MNHKIICNIQYWDDHTAYYLMESHGNGLVRLTVYDDGYSELSDLFVSEDSRKNGIATALVNEAIQYFKQCEMEPTELKVLLSQDNPYNSFLKDWYQKLGFKHKGIEAPLKSFDEDKHEFKWYDIFVMNN